eukprot:6183909-Pleurochrysis_carterae.AAC.4
MESELKLIRDQKAALSSVRDRGPENSRRTRFEESAGVSRTPASEGGGTRTDDGGADGSPGGCSASALECCAGDGSVCAVVGRHGKLVSLKYALGVTTTRRSDGTQMW